MLDSTSNMNKLTCQAGVWTAPHLGIVIWMAALESIAEVVVLGTWA